MAGFSETFEKRIDSKVQNEVTQSIEKHVKESYATQLKIKQKALIQSKVFQIAVNRVGDIIEDVYIEREEKGF